MALPASTVLRGAQNTGDQTSLAAGTALTTMVIRLFGDYSKYLEPDETPFSSSVSTGKTVNQKKLEWVQGFLAPNQVTLGATLNSGAGNVTVTLAAGDGAKVQLTDLIQITSSTGVEIAWVTAISTDTLTVVRAMGGTSALQHTLATPAQVLEILAPAAQENADSPIAPLAKGASLYNLPQLMDYAVQVSQREDNTPDYEFDAGSKYDAYLNRVMTNANIDFEKLMINGRRGGESSMVVGSGTPTTMGGLRYFTSNTYDLAGVALTETHLRTIQRDLWNAVGTNLPKVWLVGGFMREAISSLFNANRYATTKDEETTLVWNTIRTEYGDIRFQMSRYIPSGAGFFINLSDIKKHPYKGGAWAEVLLPSNGPYKKGRFTGDYTSSWPNDAARAQFVNASTLASDYANMV